MLNEFNPSKIIMGAGGITEDKGITIYEFVESEFYKKLIEKAVEKIIVTDHSKFGRDVLTHVLPLEKITTIITDDKLSPVYIDLLEKLHINYILSSQNK